MNSPDHIPLDHRLRLTALLDGELSPPEEAALRREMAASPSLRKEFEELLMQQKVLRSQHYRPPAEGVWETYWQGVYRRMERGLGWILFSFGALVLLLYGAYEIARQWIEDPALPLWVKLGGGLLCAGLLILTFSVVREKLHLHRQERYKEIQR